jgi:flagellin-like protein
MKLTNLLSDSDDSRAVSPVIGVILMVAITVILAAVIGTFVLGLGDSVESAPQTSFNFDYTADGTSSELDIRHRGGDTIDASNLEIRLDSSSANIDNDPLSGTSSLEAGDSVLVEFDAEPDSGDLVNIVYTGGGDRQDIIGSFEVP